MKNGFKRQLNKDEESLEFKLELAIIEITEAIYAQMTQRNLNKAALAKKMGVSKSMITKMLRGTTNNFTLKLLVATAAALDCELSLGLAPSGGFIKPPIFVWTNQAEDSAFTLKKQSLNAVKERPGQFEISLAEAS